MLLALLSREHHTSSDRGRAASTLAASSTDAARSGSEGDSSSTEAANAAPARPAQQPSARGSTGIRPTEAEPDANAAVLASVLARLRAEQDRAQAMQQSSAALSDPVQSPPATAQPPAESTPSTSGRFWPYTTPAGTRWDLRCTWDECLLSIDLCAGQTAAVQTAPQFGGLDRDGMDERVDYVKGNIEQAYGARASLYRFTRDGRVFPIR